MERYEAFEKDIELLRLRKEQLKTKASLTAFFVVFNSYTKKHEIVGVGSEFCYSSHDELIMANQAVDLLNTLAKKKL